MKRTVATLSAVSLLGLAVACSPAEHSDKSVAEAEKPKSPDKHAAETRRPSVAPTSASVVPTSPSVAPTSPSVAPTVPTEERLEQDFSALVDQTLLSPKAVQPLSTMSVADVALGRAHAPGAISSAEHFLSRHLPQAEDRERYDDVDPNPVKLVSAEPGSRPSRSTSTQHPTPMVRRFLEDGALAASGRGADRGR